MKKYLFLFLASITFIGCSNDDDVVSDIPTSAKIIGIWNWVQSTGGIDGSTTHTPESTASIQRLEFTTDVMKRYYNNELFSDNSYTVETSTSYLFNEDLEMIIEENNRNFIIRFEDNKMILIGDCNDCYTSEYTRE